MAYRKIHDSFWMDPDLEELTPDQRYFYIYLITNPLVNQLGVYEFSVKRASFETGYSIDTVSSLLQYFIDIGKVVVSKETKEIVVVKFYFHNKSDSPKLKKHVEGLVKSVKDTSLIQYIYGIDTLSQEEEEQEQEQEEENSTHSNEDKGSNEDSKTKCAAVPTGDEVIAYFRDNGYSEQSAIKAYEYYQKPMEETGGRVWKDGKGNTVKNWKQKMRGVWFKDENKIKQVSGKMTREEQEQDIKERMKNRDNRTYEDLINEENEQH